MHHKGRRAMIKTTWRSAASLALAAVLAIGTSTSPAAAADTTGVVSVVQYFEGSLLIIVAGVPNYAQTAPQTGCTSNSKNIDTIRTWQNLATAALMSGKQLYINSILCQGIYYTNLI